MHVALQREFVVNRKVGFRVELIVGVQQFVQSFVVLLNLDLKYLGCAKQSRGSQSVMGEGPRSEENAAMSEAGGAKRRMQGR